MGNDNSGQKVDGEPTLHEPVLYFHVLHDPNSNVESADCLEYAAQHDEAYARLKQFRALRRPFGVPIEPTRPVVAEGDWIPELVPRRKNGAAQRSECAFSQQALRACYNADVVIVVNRARIGIYKIKEFSSGKLDAPVARGPRAELAAARVTRAACPNDIRGIIGRTVVHGDHLYDPARGDFLPG
jgi:hypothetical protein